MATGPAFDDAVALAKSLPTLGVGCHIVLTDGTPASHPDEIPTLLGSDRKSFRPSLLNFVHALQRGKINEQEIAHEALAQIQKLQRASIKITHVDTHKHTHLFPTVARSLLALPTIRAIRNPFEPAFARTLPHAGFKRRLQISLLNRFRPSFEKFATQILTTDGTIGVSATGNLNATTLRQILDALPTEGTFELVCHPGYNDRDLDRVTTRLRAHRDIERQALLAEIPRILSLPQPPRLIHYGDLSNRKENTKKND
jgi:chitin disaccharide deacetylase